MINYAYTLKTIITNAEQKLQLISESKFSNKSFPKKWSKKEVLGHLIDSAVNNLTRFSKAAVEQTYFFDRYDQDQWVVMNDYQNRHSKDLIQLWSCLNSHIIRLINGIPEEILLKKVTEHNFDEICMLIVEKGSSSSLSYLIWDYLYHLEHHLSQIITNYEYELTNFEAD